MAIHTVPIAQNLTARGWAKSIGSSAKDAQVINGLIEVATNPALGTKTVYVQKRPGSIDGTTFASGVIRLKYYGSQLSAGWATSTALYADDQTNLGTLDGVIFGTNSYIVAEAQTASVGVHAFATLGGSGWFIYSDSYTDNFPTFSASLTSGQATIVGLSNTNGIYDGQLLSGSGVPSSTRVSDVLSSSTVLLSQAVTQSGTKTITKEAVSKIIDQHFPSDANSMAAMDGYFFASESNGGRIFQSAINDPASWATADTIAADFSGDNISFIFRHQGYIVAAGNCGTIQYFYNAGNASGSVLSPAENMTVTGITLINQPVPFQDGAYCIAATASNTLSGAGRNYGLFRLTGLNTYQQVSDNIVSGIILDNSLFKIGHAELGNKSVVLIHGDGSANALCYDPSNGAFTVINVGAAITSSFGAEFTKSGSSDSFIWSTGNVWTDSDVSYTLTIQTEPMDMAGGLDTTDEWADLMADVESSGTATLDVSDNDYASWTTKGTFDMTKVKKRVNALGMHSARAYRITHSANTNFRGQVLRIKHNPGQL